jgi:cell division protein FtsL
MSDQTPQSFQKHARFDPPYHLILITVLAVNLIISLEFVYDLHRSGYQHWLAYAEWLVVLAIAVFIPVLRIRSYPLKVQDRIIRLEERIRLQALAPSEWHAQIYRLTEDQLIGLRFAADEEVVELAKQAIELNLDRKQIKERIKEWRPDNWRI